MHCCTDLSIWTDGIDRKLVPRQNYDRLSNQVPGQDLQFGLFTCKTDPMLRQLRLFLLLFSRFFSSRQDLILENLALRQQLAVFERERPKPRFRLSDRLFWVLLRRMWPGWKRTLILVQPGTVIRWHRAGFKLYWTWLSQHRTRAERLYQSPVSVDSIIATTWPPEPVLRSIPNEIEDDGQEKCVC
jgi:hypothetical protein